MKDLERMPKDRERRERLQSHSKRNIQKMLKYLCMCVRVRDKERGGRSKKCV